MDTHKIIFFDRVFMHEEHEKLFCHIVIIVSNMHRRNIFQQIIIVSQIRI